MLGSNSELDIHQNIHLLQTSVVKGELPATLLLFQRRVCSTAMTLKRKCTSRNRSDDIKFALNVRKTQLYCILANTVKKKIEFVTFTARPGGQTPNVALNLESVLP